MADQNETLIMRAIEGYRGEGLRGISPEANIPECEGIYGAYLSGRQRSQIIGKEGVKERKRRNEIASKAPVKDYHGQGFEFGGITMFRPLLGYSKQALQATLEEDGMPWVNDGTNYDPTVSTRNAIRYLTQRDLLPKAFRGDLGGHPSALAVVASRIQDKSTRLNHQADELFQKCEILSFSAKTGHLHVRLPLSTTFEMENNAYSSKYQKTEAEHIGARLVRHLLNTVTPQDKISLQGLEFATKAMFSNFAFPQTPFLRKGRSSQPYTFTAGGVLCQRLNTVLKESQQPSETSTGRLDPEYTWSLSRQPYPATKPEPQCIVPPAKIHRHKWHLWDGRYWIQVRNPTSRPLTICPCTPDRLHHLRQTLPAKTGPGKKHPLKEKLKTAAQGGLRYTIPAIVTQEKGILALPTLGFATSAAEEMGVQWSVRYRRVVFPSDVDPKVISGVPDGVRRDDVVSRKWETRMVVT
ncbi:MAG: hypothetical protein Q9220_007378 [cf. Caloplaca sp. 1 TL-2023]